ncbi:hypothetical protein [Natronolimnohabitans innermongolicus]|uniref:MYXO-CTERM domain-containing protein n=1 Tax=Natronolimnohabitans innermongolicus JCM 12255 TaxID=1227499 RepID=L9XAJ2_9EURY|nr:hypothetical protein [Natronolimnohabitans innermongolicus]ELY57623.1 hypothetical protein C493_09076 [Natronolimnohabitans innermongolicus JCM 12255]
MAESEQQEQTLSELVVKEAVGIGMESPLRDSILEAVEESEGTASSGSRLPLAGALFGIGAAVGFLAGRQSEALEDTSLDDVEEPEIIEDVMDGRGEEIGSTAEEAVSSVTGDDDSETDADAGTAAESEAEPEVDVEDEGGSSRLPKLLLLVGAVAAIAVARRRFAGGEEEEWEPIEEFEPAATDDLEDSETDELTTGGAEAETDDEDDEDDESDEADADAEAKGE